MMKHTELINYVAGKIKAETYLEIGIYDTRHNFDRINIPVKIGVDPDPAVKATYNCTSDDFFTPWGISHNAADPLLFDLIFIDGLHYADQVRKDIINGWQHLVDGGVIILHDCNPPYKETTCIPRGAQREWCGDIYRTIYQIKTKKFTVDFDYGCTVLYKGDEELKFTDENITWEEFDLFRKEALNLVSFEEAKKIISSWK